MIRIRRASPVGLVALVLAGAACSVTTTTAAGSAGGSRVATRQLVDADAVPTTAVATPAGPTTALPNLPTVPTVAPPPTASPTTAPVTPVAALTFVSVEDEYGMLLVEVPATWTEIDTRPFANDDGTLRPGISASPDLDAFHDRWDIPGLVMTAYHFQPDPNILFGAYDYSARCTDAGTAAYTDEVFVGHVRTFSQCASVGSTNYVVVANPPGNQVTVVIVVQTTNAADEAAYRHVLETFNVDPNVGMPTETVPPTTTPPTTTIPLSTPPAPTAPIPSPTTPAPSAPVPTDAGPTGPAPTVAVPTPPLLPTSPLLTTPVSVPVGTLPTPTAPVPSTAGTTASAVPAGYHEVADDSGRLSVQVPATWIDIDGTPALEGGVEVAAVSAAPNLTAFRETFDVPGLVIHETSFQADPAAELARRGPAGTCTAGPVAPNPNPSFSGVHQSWLDCGGTTTDWHVLVANPIDGRQTTVVMVVQTVSPADEEALKVALSSYRLNTTV